MDRLWQGILGLVLVFIVHLITQTKKRRTASTSSSSAIAAAGLLLGPQSLDNIYRCINRCVLYVSAGQVRQRTNVHSGGPPQTDDPPVYTCPAKVKETELIRVRGLWGLSVESRVLTKWMLDTTEGPCRMRKKLTPNPNFYALYPYGPELPSWPRTIRSATKWPSVWTPRNISISLSATTGGAASFPQSSSRQWRCRWWRHLSRADNRTDWTRQLRNYAAGPAPIVATQ